MKIKFQISVRTVSTWCSSFGRFTHVFCIIILGRRYNIFTLHSKYNTPFGNNLYRREATHSNRTCAKIFEKKYNFFWQTNFFSNLLFENLFSFFRTNIFLENHTTFHINFVSLQINSSSHQHQTVTEYAKPTKGISFSHSETTTTQTVQRDQLDSMLGFTLQLLICDNILKRQIFLQETYKQIWVVKE